MRPMDNFKVVVRSYGDEDLRAIIDFIMGSEKWPSKATHCVVDDNGSLYFFWGKPGTQVSNFPVPLDAEAVFVLAKRWLDEAEYGEEPDIDGSCSKGFEVCGPTGDVWGYVILSVRPCWAHHHK